MTVEEMLTAKEGENFEFKTAENRFSYTELQKYACAISNEGGGKIVFGITDKRPRHVMIRIFKEIGEKTLSSFSTDDFRVVRYVVDGKPVPRILHSRIGRLVSLGVLERVGRSKVLVSRQYYKAIGKGGTFTRLKGLDSNTNKELLKRHMKDMGNSGLKLRDFQQVLPSLGIRNIQWLLNELKASGEVYVSGRTSAARWFLCAKPIE